MLFCYNKVHTKDIKYAKCAVAGVGSQAVINNQSAKGNFDPQTN